MGRQRRARINKNEKSKKRKAASDGDDEDTTKTRPRLELPENKQRIQAPTNPLLIDVVLDKVFGYIAYSSNSGDDNKTILNTCRLVCKFWRNRATSAIQKSAPATVLGTVVSLCSSDSERNNVPDAELEKFMEIMNSRPMPALIPAASERFWIQESICVQNSGSKKLFSKFMKMLGPEIEELNFKSRNLNDLYCPIADLNNLAMGKLKVLRIFSSDFSTPPQEYKPNFDFLTFVGALLDASPNLSLFEFRISDKGLWFEEEAKKIGELFQRIPDNVTILALESRFLGSTHYDILSKRKKPLDELMLVMTRDPPQSRAMELRNPFEFLRQLSTTLKALTVEGIYSKSFNEFPEMTKLEHFCAVENGGPFEGLRDTPFWTNSAKTYFPNLKSLELYINDFTQDKKEMLCDVFNNFVHIEELSLIIHLEKRSKNFMASLLSGVPIPKFAVMHRRNRRRKVDEIMLQELRSHPSILKLTRLRKLKLVNINPLCDSKFTTLSDSLIFSKMKYLEELTIQGFELLGNLQDLLKSKVKKCNFYYEKGRELELVFV